MIELICISVWFLGIGVIGVYKGIQDCQEGLEDFWPILIWPVFIVLIPLAFVYVASSEFGKIINNISYNVKINKYNLEKNKEAEQIRARRESERIWG